MAVFNLLWLLLWMIECAFLLFLYILFWINLSIESPHKDKYIPLEGNIPFLGNMFKSGRMLGA